MDASRPDGAETDSRRGPAERVTLGLLRTVTA
jgi:hypothetical protein